MGYEVVEQPEWHIEFSAVGAVIRTVEGLLAGSDPRGETWAAGISS
ncbi:MAG: hypothetical protein ACE5I1_24215 [bacterium]